MIDFNNNPVCHWPLTDYFSIRRACPLRKITKSIWNIAMIQHQSNSSHSISGIFVSTKYNWPSSVDTLPSLITWLLCKTMFKSMCDIWYSLSWFKKYTIY